MWWVEIDFWRTATIEIQEQCIIWGEGNIRGVVTPATKHEQAWLCEDFFGVLR